MQEFFIAIGLLAVVLPTCAGRILNQKNELADSNTNETRLLSIGGFTLNGPLDEVDIYSLTTNSKIKQGTSMPSGLGGFGSVKVNDTIYIVGGAYTDTFWSYDIVKDKWNGQLPRVPTATTNTAAVELNGLIYAFGGYNFGDNPNSDVYVYDIKQQKWQKIDTPLPEAAAYPCAVAQQGNMYFMAQNWAHSTSNWYRSNDGAKIWQQLSSPERPYENANCIAIADTDAILKIGGSDYQRANGATNHVELYNTTTNTWKSIGPMNVGRGDLGAAQIPNSKDVVVCGGRTAYNLNEDYVSSCEVYKWDVKYWKIAEFELGQAAGGLGLFAV